MDRIPIIRIGMLFFFFPSSFFVLIHSYLQLRYAIKSIKKLCFCATLNSRYRIKFAFEKKVFKNSKTIYSTDSMGILAKLGALFLLLIIVIAFLYFFERQTFCSIFSSVMNQNISSKICGSTNHISPTISKMLGMEANAIESSSPIQIKQVFVFGAGTTIQNTTQSEFNNMYYNFSLQRTSQLNVLSNGFYVPIYAVIEETYYKSNSTSIGDYIPSLIGQKVYLSFIDANTHPNKNFSASYIIKSETIQGNKVIWNLTFEGSTSNATKILYNTTYSWINGIILLNHTALLSPRNPYIK